MKLIDDVRLDSDPAVSGEYGLDPNSLRSHGIIEDKIKNIRSFYGTDNQFKNYVRYNVSRHLPDNSCNFTQAQLRYIESLSNGSYLILTRQHIEAGIADGYTLGTRYVELDPREGDLVRKVTHRVGNRETV